jgi:hypothetical protein
VWSLSVVKTYVRLESAVGYLVTINDDAEAEFVAATITELCGADRCRWMANLEGFGGLLLVLAPTNHAGGARRPAARPCGSGR